jgi:hypothetical protein
MENVTSGDDVVAVATCTLARNGVDIHDSTPLATQNCYSVQKVGRLVTSNHF